ncbi:unnamed protein product, partial [Mesorhabditis spiculigera]
MLHVAGGWLLVLLLQVVDTMDFCEYFARLGVDKPECRKQIHFDTFDPNPRPALHSYGAGALRIVIAGEQPRRHRPEVPYRM